MEIFETQDLSSPNGKPKLLFYDYSCHFFFLQPIAEGNCELEKHLSHKYIFLQKNTLSFLPHYCHSFHITVIPSEHCHSFRIITISNICHGHSFGTLPYPKGEKNGHRRWPYMRVVLNKSSICTYSLTKN